MKLIKELDVPSLGSNMHGALRRACDSKATSAMYNAVVITDPEVWDLYLRHVLRCLKEKDNDDLDITEWGQIVKRAWLNVFNTYDIRAIRAIGKLDLEAQVNLLHCIGCLMSDVDWALFINYIVERETDNVTPSQP